MYNSKVSYKKNIIYITINIDDYKIDLSFYNYNSSTFNNIIKTLENNLSNSNKIITDMNNKEITIEDGYLILDDTIEQIEIPITNNNIYELIDLFKGIKKDAYDLLKIVQNL
jgi:hypothetical protein